MMTPTLTLRAIRFEIEGITPTIMHNGALADPLHPVARAMKAVSSKRKKTEDDYARLADLEWEGSLYLDAEGRIVWPGYVLEAALVGAAKKLRLGDAAKAGIGVDEDAVLEYEGPRDLASLKADPAFRSVAGVRVQASKVMRTRPIFHTWRLTFTVIYDVELLDADQVRQIVNILGKRVGLSDWRPRFGRFRVLNSEEVDVTVD